MVCRYGEAQDYQTVLFLQAMKARFDQCDDLCEFLSTIWKLCDDLEISTGVDMGSVDRMEDEIISERVTIFHQQKVRKVLQLRHFSWKFRNYIHQRKRYPLRRMMSC